jgi:hypothetical protein
MGTAAILGATVATLLLLLAARKPRSLRNIGAGHAGAIARQNSEFRHRSNWEILDTILKNASFSVVSGATMADTTSNALTKRNARE